MRSRTKILVTVPQLHEDQTALLVNRLGNFAPPLYMLIGPNPRCVRPFSAASRDLSDFWVQNWKIVSLPLVANKSALGQYKTSTAGTLSVILSIGVIGYGCWEGSTAGHGRHDIPVSKLNITQFNRRVECNGLLVHCSHSWVPGRRCLGVDMYCEDERFGETSFKGR